MYKILAGILRPALPLRHAIGLPSPEAYLGVSLSSQQTHWLKQGSSDVAVINAPICLLDRRFGDRSHTGKTRSVVAGVQLIEASSSWGSGIRRSDVAPKEISK